MNNNFSCFTLVYDSARAMCLFLPTKCQDKQKYKDKEKWKVIKYCAGLLGKPYGEILRITANPKAQEIKIPPISPDSPRRW